uniref:Uncharacterized protein n=1 Tax=Cannabis sativa TaxID=3483 RepID=A0A803R519_CANSA
MTHNVRSSFIFKVVQEDINSCHCLNLFDFRFFSTYGVTELSLLAKNFSHIDTPFFSSREVYPPWHYILSMFIKCNGILFSSRNRQCLGVSNGYFSVLVACNVF